MNDDPTIPASPYDEGDEDEPAFQPRPRRRAHRVTFLLAGALLVAAGFYGGVLLQKHEDHGSSSSAGANASGFAGRAARFAASGGTGTTTPGATTAGGAGGAGGTGGGGRFGGFGGAGGAGGGVTGQVKLVDGANVYVTDSDGNVVKVTTNGTSQLTKTDPATTKDVAPGDVVTVRGTQNSDGSYSASSLVIIPASAVGAATGG